MRTEDPFDALLHRYRRLLFSVCRRYSRGGKYYFCFILPEAKVKRLPDALVHQALSFAQKVDKMITGRVGKKGSRKNK